MSDYSVSTLFSSLSSSDSSSLSLIDYNLIRSGTYSKLMEAYYSDDDSDDTDSDVQEVELQLANSSAAALENSASELLETGDSSVFNKVTTTDEDGNTTTSYDMDAIYEKVSAFIEDYNSMIEAGGESDDTAVLRAVASMTGSTEANEDLLNEIGITIESDNTLSIDEETFKDEDNISAIKTLFNGYGSYAYRIQTKAQSVQTAALTALNKLGTYTSSGTYDASAAVGSIYDGTV